MPLNILFQDAHFVAIDKPPGMLVHRSRISTDSVFVLQTLRDQLQRRVYPVHRLDRATSGVLVFGLSAAAAGLLVRQFERRSVDKEYLAVVRGWVGVDDVIDHPLSDDEGSGRLQGARTRYHRLATIELPVRVDRYPSSRYSLVSVVPETGRRQQIRKHFKHISHHLIGDTTHGNGRHNRLFRERYNIRRLLLMARRLDFDHPYRGRRVSVSAALDGDWTMICRLFGYNCGQAPLEPDPAIGPPTD